MDKKQGVNTLGYSVEELPNLKTVKRMDFISENGDILPNLPVDAYHLPRWQARGFRPYMRPEVNPLVCPICGAGPFKAKIGLIGHQRKHTQN